MFSIMTKERYMFGSVVIFKIAANGEYLVSIISRSFNKKLYEQGIIKYI